jgi:carnitine 3-dehydrogenase
MRVAAVGAGVIGAGWIARFVLHGHDVAVFELKDDTFADLERIVDRAGRSYANLGIGAFARGTITRSPSIPDAVAGADLIQESVPEVLSLKRSVLESIDSAALPDSIICSSTSGLLPTQLQETLTNPGRFVVGHPFNPVYLLPVVEVVGGSQTTLGTIERAQAIYSSVGMKPLHIRKEIDAFVADRLLEAVWREALWLVHDGVATTEEIDDVIRYGFGLRWAQMGMFETYRIAGGPAGMRHFMAQFGPALAWPWSKLTDVPPFNDELVDLIATQSDQQSGMFTIGELEETRDANLVAILQALRVREWGAGALLDGKSDRSSGERSESEGSVGKSPDRSSGERSESEGSVGKSPDRSSGER